MTITSVIDKVRRLLQDESNPYHWSDEKLKSDLQLAIRALHKVRPETRYVNCGLVDCVMLPSSLTAELDIDARFEDALIYYVAYVAYSDDCTDNVSKTLADDFLSKFNVFAAL